jgi:hypothetical protein
MKHTSVKVRKQFSLLYPLSALGTVLLLLKTHIAVVVMTFCFSKVVTPVHLNSLVLTCSQRCPTRAESGRCHPSRSTCAALIRSELQAVRVVMYSAAGGLD